MIALTAEIKKRLRGALTDGHPVVVGYVESSGDPHVSFYGSVHAYDDETLGLWVRNLEGELLKAIPQHPKLAFAYSDLPTRVYYLMRGRAAVTTDQDERRRIFEGMHEIEQRGDPERKGVAILVELDELTGRDGGGPFAMTRGQ